MKYIIAILLLLTVNPAFTKRIPAPIVLPVQYNGIQYAAPNDNGRIAYVNALDLRTGQTLWSSTVFRNYIDPKWEEDVQWIYIANLHVVQNKLLVTDERDRTYHIELVTGHVRQFILPWIGGITIIVILLITIIYFACGKPKT